MRLAVFNFNGAPKLLASIIRVILVLNYNKMPRFKPKELEIDVLFLR
jgi:hypothetical protein